MVVAQALDEVSFIGAKAAALETSLGASPAAVAKSKAAFAEADRLNQVMADRLKAFKEIDEAQQGINANAAKYTKLLDDIAAKMTAARAAANTTSGVLAPWHGPENYGTGAMERRAPAGPGPLLGPGKGDLAAANRAEEIHAASLAHTAELWDQFNAIVEKGAGDTLAKQLADIDRWVAKEIEALEKSKATQQDYYEQLAAVSSVATAKRNAAEVAAFKALTDQLEKANQDRLDAQYAASVADADRQKALDDASLARFVSAQTALRTAQAKDSMTARDFQALQLQETLNTELMASDALGQHNSVTYQNIKEAARLALSQIGVLWDEETNDWVHTFER
jgi:hypothetical protein